MKENKLIDYKDIIKLTSIGSYQVGIDLKNLKREVNRYEEKYGLILNPDFQRGHVWNDQQQIKYVEYILKGGKAQTTLYFNHPGWTNSFEGDFVLVDGLQRITACLKFFNNEIKVFNNFYNNIQGDFPRDTGLTFNINNLKTRKEVLNWYLEMNTGGTIHSKEAIDKVKSLLDDLPC